MTSQQSQNQNSQSNSRVKRETDFHSEELKKKLDLRTLQNYLAIARRQTSSPISIHQIFKAVNDTVDEQTLIENIASAVRDNSKIQFWRKEMNTYEYDKDGKLVNEVQKQQDPRYLQLKCNLYSCISNTAIILISFDKNNHMTKDDNIDYHNSFSALTCINADWSDFKHMFICTLNEKDPGQVLAYQDERIRRVENQIEEQIIENKQKIMKNDMFLHIDSIINNLSSNTRAKNQYNITKSKIEEFVLVNFTRRITGHLLKSLDFEGQAVWNVDQPGGVSLEEAQDKYTANRTYSLNHKKINRYIGYWKKQFETIQKDPITNKNKLIYALYKKEVNLLILAIEKNHDTFKWNDLWSTDIKPMKEIAELVVSRSQFKLLVKELKAINKFQCSHQNLANYMVEIIWKKYGYLLDNLKNFDELIKQNKISDLTKENLLLDTYFIFPENRITVDRFKFINQELEDFTKVALKLDNFNKFSRNSFVYVEEFINQMSKIINDGRESKNKQELQQLKESLKRHKKYIKSCQNDLLLKQNLLLQKKQDQPDYQYFIKRKRKQFNVTQNEKKIKGIKQQGVKIQRQFINQFWKKQDKINFMQISKDCIDQEQKTRKMIQSKNKQELYDSQAVDDLIDNQISKIKESYAEKHLQSPRYKLFNNIERTKQIIQTIAKQSKSSNSDFKTLNEKKLKSINRFKRVLLNKRFFKKLTKNSKLTFNDLCKDIWNLQKIQDNQKSNKNEILYKLSTISNNIFQDDFKSNKKFYFDILNILDVYQKKQVSNIFENMLLKNQPFTDQLIKNDKIDVGDQSISYLNECDLIIVQEDQIDQKLIRKIKQLRYLIQKYKILFKNIQQKFKGNQQKSFTKLKNEQIYSLLKNKETTLSQQFKKNDKQLILSNKRRPQITKNQQQDINISNSFMELKIIKTLKLSIEKESQIYSQNEILDPITNIKDNKEKSCQNEYLFSKQTISREVENDMDEFINNFTDRSILDDSKKLIFHDFYEFEADADILKELNSQQQVGNFLYDPDQTEYQNSKYQYDYQGNDHKLRFLPTFNMGFYTNVFQDNNAFQDHSILNLGDAFEEKGQQELEDFKSDEPYELSNYKPGTELFTKQRENTTLEEARQYREDLRQHQLAVYYLDYQNLDTGLQDAYLQSTKTYEPYAACIIQSFQVNFEYKHFILSQMKNIGIFTLNVGRNEDPNKKLASYNFTRKIENNKFMALFSVNGMKFVHCSRFLEESEYVVLQMLYKQFFGEITISEFLDIQLLTNKRKAKLANQENKEVQLNCARMWSDISENHQRDTNMQFKKRKPKNKNDEILKQDIHIKSNKIKLEDND